MIVAAEKEEEEEGEEAWEEGGELERGEGASADSVLRGKNSGHPVLNWKADLSRPC